MSVAILPMASDFSWDSGEQGLIQSSIFWGYAATQVVGGLLSTRFGAFGWDIRGGMWRSPGMVEMRHVHGFGRL